MKASRPAQSIYLEVLQHELARRCEKNPKYSLRAFARALKVAPGTLSQIFSKKYVPSYRVTQLILENLELTPSQKRDFLSSIAQQHHQRGLKRLTPAFRNLKIQTPKLADLSIDAFQVMADWYHYAIIMLIHCESFRYDIPWIARQLGISPSEASVAIERLRKLELVAEENGTLKATEGYTTSDPHITTAALRRHQRQMLEKAIHSLENDPIEVRNVTSYTMAIDPKKIPEAKKLVARFTEEMSHLLETGPRKCVYQLGISLFPLQKVSGGKNEK